LEVIRAVSAELPDVVFKPDNCPLRIVHIVQKSDWEEIIVDITQVKDGRKRFQFPLLIILHWLDFHSEVEMPHEVV